MIAAGHCAATAAIVAGYRATGGASAPQDARSIARLVFWSVLFGQALRPALCAFSRSREWAADMFARAATQAPEFGAAALRRLRDQNLAEDEQPAWFEFLFSTHPPLGARVAALERAGGRDGVTPGEAAAL